MALVDLGNIKRLWLDSSAITSGCNPSRGV